MTNQLGTQIRLRRMARNLTRAAVVQKTHLDYYHYCGIERGKVSPNLKTVNRIADALGCDVVVTLKPKDSEVAE